MKKAKVPLIIFSAIIVVAVAYLAIVNILDKRVERNLPSILITKGYCSSDQSIFVYGKVEGLWEVNCLTPGEPFSTIRYFTSKGDRGTKIFFED